MTTSTAVAERDERAFATAPLYQLLARAARRWHSLAMMETRFAKTSPDREAFWSERAQRNRDLAWAALADAREAKDKALTRTP